MFSDNPPREEPSDYAGGRPPPSFGPISGAEHATYTTPMHAAFPGCFSGLADGFCRRSPGLRADALAHGNLNSDKHQVVHTSSGSSGKQAIVIQPAEPTLYKSPEEAAQALIQAAKAQNTAALEKVLGPQAKDLINSGDTAADKEDRAAFVAAWEKKHSLKTQADGRVSLVLGERELTFPVPLVKDALGKWRFDGVAGMEELMDRRIGRNELSAMQVCRAIGDAERDYYNLNLEGSKIKHFARKIVSSPGKRDGLYWQSAADEQPSPLGKLAAEATDDGYNNGTGSYHGYRYRILTGQGKSAPGGAYDYVADNLMFGGFAVLAYPEKYGVSGVMSFMLGHDGTLYESNLGKGTAARAAEIIRFDPEQSWQKVVDDTE